MDFPFSARRMRFYFAYLEHCAAYLTCVAGLGAGWQELKMHPTPPTNATAGTANTAPRHKTVRSFAVLIYEKIIRILWGVRLAHALPFPRFPQPDDYFSSCLPR